MLHSMGMADIIIKITETEAPRIQRVLQYKDRTNVVRFGNWYRSVAERMVRGCASGCSCPYVKLCDMHGSIRKV